MQGSSFSAADEANFLAELRGEAEDLHKELKFGQKKVFLLPFRSVRQPLH